MLQKTTAAGNREKKEAQVIQECKDLECQHSKNARLTALEQKGYGQGSRVDYGVDVKVPGVATGGRGQGRGDKTPFRTLKLQRRPKESDSRGRLR